MVMFDIDGTLTQSNDLDDAAFLKALFDVMREQPTVFRTMTMPKISLQCWHRWHNNRLHTDRLESFPSC